MELYGQLLIGEASALDSYASGAGNFLGQRRQALFSGIITEFRYYTNANVNIKVALYADSAGSIGSRLWVDNTGTAIVSPYGTIAVSSLPISAGSYYWLGTNQDGIVNYNLAGTGGVRKLVAADYTTIGCPETPTGLSDDTYKSGIACYGLIGRNNAMIF